MTNIEKHMDILGCRVVDRVTLFDGVAVSISFDLFGCIQVLVNPGMDKDGKLKESFYFDINRLNILSDKPVMNRPNYNDGYQAEGLQGAAEKPRYHKA